MSQQTTAAKESNRPSSFSDWWQRTGPWVENPNERRGGYSGVQLLEQDGRRLYLKRQINHCYRSLRHLRKRPTILRERDAMLAMGRLGVRVPELIYCAARCHERRWQALLVSAELDGFSDLEQWYRVNRPSGQWPVLGEQMLRQLAASLARMHQAGWQHGCLYAKHIFVRTCHGGEAGQVQVALLDWEKSRRLWSAAKAARRDLDQLRRHSPLDAGSWATLLSYHQSFFRGLAPGSGPVPGAVLPG